MAAVLALVLTAACAGSPTATAPPASAPASNATIVPTAPSLPNIPTPTSRPKGTSPPLDADAGATDSEFPELGSAGLDVTHYDLDLDYEVAQQRLQAVATIDAQVAAPTRSVVFDLRDLDVDAVAVEGEDATFAVEGPKLRIDLPHEVEAATPFTVRVTYHGVPQPVATDALDGIEIGWYGARDGSFVLAEPEGASTWFPVNNHPRDKAMYSFAVTVPKPYVAIANGHLDRTDEHAQDRTYHWVMDAPMANYLATVVTGDFVEQPLGTHGGVTYANWLPVDRSGAGAEEPLAPDQPDVIAGLEDWLGPFPFSTYGAVVYPSSFIKGSVATRQFLSGVALETQGRSLYSEQAAKSSTITHESAHQWMGDSVSIEDWGKDIWWVEGFATFAESLDAPKRAEKLEKMYDSVVGSWMPPGHLDRNEIFSSAAYVEGAVVFWALEQQVGQDTFKQILHAFTERYRHANASTQDLIRVASDVSGQDLGPFFDAWLFAATPPPFPS